MSWKTELREKIVSRRGIEKFFSLSPGEAAWFERAGAEKTGPADGCAENSSAPVFAFQATAAYLALAGRGEDDPIRRQCVPRVEEFSQSPGEMPDPLADQAHSPCPRLVHRYADRALLLVTDTCALACRYCFRRYYTGRGRGSITARELGEAAAWLKARPAIGEVILSGGDPLTLDDGPLFRVIDALREARPGLVLRLSTRAPAALPSRITARLSRGLGSRRPLWIVFHVNHPRELSPACADSLRRLADAGLPLLSQSVLLAGVNDSEEVLEALFRGLAALGVKPYYLFQGDMAAGTAHFRVALRRGWEIMRRLRTRLSALALPQYAVDLPGGGGKVPLGPSYLKGEEGGFWLFENIEGREYRYPKEGF